MARKQSSEQSEGCCLPLCALESRGPGAFSCQDMVRGSFSSEWIHTLKGVREGGEVLPLSAAQEQKASETERGKNQLSLGKRQRREYGEIKPDPVTGDC